VTEIRLTVPIPNKALWPNARPHWAAKAKAVRNARAGAWARANIAIDGWPPKWMEAETRTVFYMATKRAVDRDNAQAAMKSIWDGIADAGVIRNDAGFIHHPPQMLHDPKNPRVEITIVPLTGETQWK